MLKSGIVCCEFVCFQKNEQFRDQLRMSRGFENSQQKLHYLKNV